MSKKTIQIPLPAKAHTDWFVGFSAKRIANTMAIKESIEVLGNEERALKTLQGLFADKKIDVGKHKRSKLIVLHVKTIVAVLESFLKYPKLKKHGYFIFMEGRILASQFELIVAANEGGNLASDSSFNDGDGMTSCVEAIEAYEDAIMAYERAVTELALCQASEGDYPTSPTDPFEGFEEEPDCWSCNPPWPRPEPQPPAPCQSQEDMMVRAQHMMQQAYLTYEFVCNGVDVGGY